MGDGSWHERLRIEVTGSAFIIQPLVDNAKYTYLDFADQDAIIEFGNGVLATSSSFSTNPDHNISTFSDLRAKNTVKAWCVIDVDPITTTVSATPIVDGYNITGCYETSSTRLRVDFAGNMDDADYAVIAFWERTTTTWTSQYSIRLYQTFTSVFDLVVWDNNTFTAQDISNLGAVGLIHIL